MSTNDGATRPQLSETELSRLLEVGRALVSELDVESVLHQVLETSRELTAASYAALGILDEAKQELDRFLFIGIDEERRRVIGPLPRGHGVLGELIRHPNPLRLADVAAHPRSFGFPAGHPPMTSFLGVPIAIRGEVFGNLYLTEKSGSEQFTESDEELVVVLAEWAAIAIDNARLYQDVQRRRNELERAVRGLEATATVARSVGFETDLERVLELIAERGRALVGAGSMLVLLEDSSRLQVMCEAGDSAGGALGVRLRAEGTLAGSVLATGAGARVPCLADRVGHGLDAITGSATSAVVAPLGFRGRARGVLVALDREHGSPAFDGDDEHLLTSFAASAAIAIATAQSVEAERLRLSILAAEAERKRWARELHDETLQELGALKLLLQGGQRADGLGMAQAAMGQAVEQLQLSIEGLQNLITDLRPAALDELGVGPALEALVARTAASSGLDIESSIDLADTTGRATTRLTGEIEGTLYRVVQEALTNAIKHAGAERVWIEITEDEDVVTVSVSDDGGGFDPDRTRGGFGLVGMRERVQLVAGQLLVDSAHAKGTVVRAQLPARHDHGSTRAEAERPRPSPDAGAVIGPPRSRRRER